jgi:hypothetical protein
MEKPGFSLFEQEDCFFWGLLRRGRVFHQLKNLVSERFGSPFVFSFPTMTVITLTTTAPGYEPRQEVMKPHYRRNVTLTIDIPLAPVPSEED